MNIIKILFDYQIFQNQKFGGISRYFKQLIDYYSKKKDVKIVIPLLRSQNYYTRNHCAQNITTPHRYDALINCLILYGSYIRSLYSGEAIDIIHATYYYPVYMRLWPSSWRKRTKLIITVHDLICELFDPDIELSLERRAKTIVNADGIIVISENTKKDLLRVYPQIDQNKIAVIYHGVDLNSFKNQKEVDVGKRYILYVGVREKYKNAERYMRALGIIARENADLQFVFVGGGKFTNHEISILQQEGIIEQTKQLDASDEQLYYLYSHAICFVYPSLYEGFGIPILEAFACGCPVVLSNSSCFPEIAQDAALYFDGNSEEEISEKITKLLNDDKLRQLMIKEGYKRVKNFSIENTAEKTLSFYKQVMDGV